MSSPLPVDEEIWQTDESAQHIQRLSAVEQDIVKLMELASTSIALLALPQTDDPGSELPRGPERSAMFAQTAEEYFARLNDIQIGIRSSLARVRQARIAPTSLKVPDPNAPPATLGTGLTHPTLAQKPEKRVRGFQEGRVEKDAWSQLVTDLERLKQVLQNKNEPSQGNKDVNSQEINAD